MAATATERATTMKAIVQDRYGSADTLVAMEVDRPQVGDDEVLIRGITYRVNEPWYDAQGTVTCKLARIS